MLNSYTDDPFGDIGSGNDYSGAAAGSTASTAATGGGTDATTANAWWRSIHPDMAGEGIAGGDSTFYPDPPSWFTGSLDKDPYTGRSYSFGPNAWALQDELLPSVNRQGGDVGNEGAGAFGYYDAPDYNDQGWLNSIGYNGPTPYAWQGSYDNGESRLDPAFNQFLQDNDLRLGMGATPFQEGSPQWLRLQAFNQEGKTVGDEHRWMKEEADPQFTMAMAALASVAGGAGAGMAAGAMGAEAGGLLAGAASGAGAGLGAGLANYGLSADALKSGALGALGGGFTAGVNPAGAMGFTDPSWTKPINSAIGAGLKSGVSGGDIKGSVLNSLMTSGLGAGINAGVNGVNNMDFGGGVGNYMGQDPSYDADVTQPQQTDWRTSLGLNTGGQSMSTPDGGFMGMFGGAEQASPYASYANVQSMPDPYAGQDLTGNGMEPGQYQQKTAGVNPIILQRMQAQSAGLGASPGRFDNMAGNLMGLYSAYRQKKMAGQQAGQLRDLFSQNSPYAQQLKQTLLRQDAAAGRRSQVGPRAVELQARLAEMNSRNAPLLNQLYGQQGTARDRALSALMRMGMGGPQGGGGFDWLKGLAGQGMNWWDQQQNGGSTAYQNTDWAPGD